MAKISFHLCNVSVLLVTFMRVEVCTASMLGIEVFRVGTQSSWVNDSRRFEGTYHPRLQGSKGRIRMTNMGDVLNLQNVPQGTVADFSICLLCLAFF